MNIKTNSLSSDKFILSDNILQILDLSSQKYSIAEIDKFIKKKFNKGSKDYVIINDNNIKHKLQLKSNCFRIRRSYLLNHILRYFVIINERPTTKYFSNDCDFNILDNKQISSIIYKL